MPFGGAQVTDQFRVIALRVVDQKARVHLEEARHKVRDDCVICGRLPLSICKISWLNHAGLGLNALHQLLLGERAMQAAERTLNLAEVANFLSQRHMPNRNNNIAIWNIERLDSTPFAKSFRGEDLHW